jgi:hypothetical protein
VLDRRGHVHLVFVRPHAVFTDSVAYGSNASGKWREQTIPARAYYGGISCDFGFLYSDCPYPPLLAYDAATDRIVVLAQDHGIRVATTRASANKLGRFRTLTAANKRHLAATGLAARAGHIAVGLEAKQNPLPAESSGPLYLWADGQLLRVPRTTANDQGLLLAASSRDRVQLAWHRRSAIWDRTQQGIWTAEGVRNTKTGRWSIRNIRHRSNSHYDSLTTLTVTGLGRPLIAYTRG